MAIAAPQGGGVDGRLRAPAGGYPLGVRAALALVACALVAGLSGCGPQGPAEEGGDPGRPVEIVAALPSPGALRGDPGADADPSDLARAFTGRDDAGLAEVIASRTPSAAAARSWRAPGGGTLTVAASVWPSHLIATGVGADLAARLVADGGAAWTPGDLPGARGARRELPRELRLGLSQGPNALYVRATGDVSEQVAVRAIERMALVLEGQTG